MKQVDHALELVEKCQGAMNLSPAERVADMIIHYPRLLKCLRALAKRDQRLIELRDQLKHAVAEVRQALWATQDPTAPGFKGGGRLAQAQSNLDRLLIELQTVISQDEV